MAAPLRRTWLFVPGSQPQRFAKAAGAGAHVVIVDLEDAVAPQVKEQARAAVAEAVKGRLFAPAPELCVRINATDTPWFGPDLEAVTGPGLSMVMLPKCERVEQLLEAGRRLDDLERHSGMAAGSVRLVPLVETARGVLAAAALAGAPRVTAVAFGSLDFIRDVSGRLTPGGNELLSARSLVVLGARAAGVEPVDSVYPRLEDEAGLLREAEGARDLGFAGKLAIHPRQLPVIRQGFRPTTDEQAYAREVVERFREALARGEAVVMVGGKMVDPPVLRWAEGVLAELYAEQP